MNEIIIGVILIFPLLLGILALASLWRKVEQLKKKMEIEMRKEYLKGYLKTKMEDKKGLEELDNILED